MNLTQEELDLLLNMADYAKENGYFEIDEEENDTTEAEQYLAILQKSETTA